MDAYKVFGFKAQNEILIIEASLPSENKKEAFVQAFKLDGSCLPFRLFFHNSMEPNEVLKVAIEDGAAHAQEIESLKGEKVELTINDVITNLNTLSFIKENCISKKLSMAIGELIQQHKTAHK